MAVTNPYKRSYVIKVNAVVVGAGVVGLACALMLARQGREVLVLEAEPIFGSGTSSRNSQVIHAGIYYPPGSLKARLCVRGRDLMYAFCEERGVPHRALGKLIFAASDDELPILDAIAVRAAAAGVALERLTGAEAKRLEPALGCAGALHSPLTGIVDAHALMLAFLGEIEARGGQLVCGAPVTAVRRRAGSWEVQVGDDPEAVVQTDVLVNAAGLGAQELAALVEGLDPAHVPSRVLVRGCYFGYDGAVPFSRLIYPVPVPGGLGTHLTLDLAGRGRFGPDTEPIDRIDYAVDPGRHPSFVRAAQRIWPTLDPGRLRPDYAGIRPKVAGTDADFVITSPQAHGLPGLVQLFGIESPGLTASLALGEEVAARLEP